MIMFYKLLYNFRYSTLANIGREDFGARWEADSRLTTKGTPDTSSNIVGAQVTSMDLLEL